MNASSFFFFFFPPLMLDLLRPFCGENILSERISKLFRGLTGFPAWSYYSNVCHFSLNIYFFIKYCLYKNLFLLSSFRKWRRVLAYSFYKIIPSELPFYDCLAKPRSVICNPRSKLLTSTDNGSAVKLIIAAKGCRPFLHLLSVL